MLTPRALPSRVIPNKISRSVKYHQKSFSIVTIHASAVNNGYTKIEVRQINSISLYNDGSLKDGSVKMADLLRISFHNDLKHYLVH